MTDLIDDFRIYTVDVQHLEILVQASHQGVQGLGVKFHDQGDAKWMVIRAQLRGHNDTPCGRPAPGRPVGRLGVGRPQAVFGGF
jgi:hypothetical protein